MTAVIPTIEPTKLRAGYTWQWKRQDLASDYPAPTWTLKYALKNATQHIEITAAADGSYFSVSVAPATNGSYVAGTYRWSAWVESGTEKHDVGEGWIEIEASFTGTTALDARTHARKTLDALEAVIEGRATIDQQEYAIAGRSLKRMSVNDLLKFRDYYRAEVAAETSAEQAAAGRGGRPLSVRL